jgi:hypothetical protein
LRHALSAKAGTQSLIVIETAAGNVRIEHTDLSDIDASDFSFG